MAYLIRKLLRRKESNPEKEETIVREEVVEEAVIFDDLQTLLDEKENGRIDVVQFYELFGGQKYKRVMNGIGYPSAGVMGEWSKEETEQIVSLYEAMKHGDCLDYFFAKVMTGEDDKGVAGFREAFEILRSMRIGDVRRICLARNSYMAVAIPDVDGLLPVQGASLAVFLKE